MDQRRLYHGDVTVVYATLTSGHEVFAKVFGDIGLEHVALAKSQECSAEHLIECPIELFIGFV